MFNNVQKIDALTKYSLSKLRKFQKFDIFKIPERKLEHKISQTNRNTQNFVLKMDQMA